MDVTSSLAEAEEVCYVIEDSALTEKRLTES